MDIVLIVVDATLVAFIGLQIKSLWRMSDDI